MCSLYRENLNSHLKSRNLISRKNVYIFWYYGKAKIYSCYLRSYNSLINIVYILEIIIKFEASLQSDILCPCLNFVCIYFAARPSRNSSMPQIFAACLIMRPVVETREFPFLYTRIQYICIYIRVDPINDKK